MAQIRFGPSAIPVPKASSAIGSETILSQVLRMLRSLRRGRRQVITCVGSIAALALCAFQFGDRKELNKMPFTEVQLLVSDPARARRLAKQGNIDLLIGQAVPGKDVSLRGEISKANCYSSSHPPAYDHAFRAKLCAAAGGPLVFIPDQGEDIYLVLSEWNGTRLPENALDGIGVPGIMVKGKALNFGGVRAIAIEE